MYNMIVFIILIICEGLFFILIIRMHIYFSLKINVTDGHRFYLKIYLLFVCFDRISSRLCVAVAYPLIDA